MEQIRLAVRKSRGERQFVRAGQTASEPASGALQPAAEPQVAPLPQQPASLPAPPAGTISGAKGATISSPAEDRSLTHTRQEKLKESYLERHRVVAVRLNHQVTDTYRALRAQVLQRMARTGATTLGITSIDQGEGKTLTAVNLAIAIAMDVNQTVLLVDADLRRPGVARTMGFKSSPALGDYLRGQASVAGCLVNPGLERLAILPASGQTRDSAELLTSPKMTQLAQELKARYPDRIVIYDLPPLLSVGDTIGFLPNLNATMLVVRDGQARSSDVKRAVGLLREHNLIGTILNAAR